MRITVIGGHGRTGILIVEQAVAAGHQVVATIRKSKDIPDIVKLGAEAFMLDLDSSGFDDIVTAMKGSDAVVFAAGSATGEGSALDRQGVVRTLKAAKRAGVKRYLAISSIGASTGMSTRSMSEEMKDYYRQKRAAGKHIRDSGLDWTIIEPGELTDGGGTGKVTLSEEALTEDSIPRADVAAVVVAALEEPKTTGHAYQLVRGKSLIKTALKAALR